MPLKTIIFSVLFIFILLSHIPAHSFISEAEIASCQKEIAGRPVGERIAIWAEKFVGTPYDPDPMGEYVSKNAIVADERVDCMYLSFRAIELAMSISPDEAIGIALDKRFINKGVLDSKGKVVNYDDRFQYGEDMLDSGKWGREITNELGDVTGIKGSRGREKVMMLSRATLLNLLKSSKGSSASGGFKDGDFIFFIKVPEKRKVGEIVGHIGIIKIEPGIHSTAHGEIYLIHAGGVKNKGGKVKKERLFDYISAMPFAGIRVSRFE